jgi:hypothetical protein
MARKLNFTQINALAKPELEVFTNSFSYHDDDYFHKNIGSLFGVIQVTDHSKNSEYLPNLLTSILKKTFYSNANKTTEQNFELALKKANLALADLAEHDIVEWNKNLHALVGVLHKDKLFFTQVGNALISIGRDDKIMHLSEPGTNTPHPIKTFQDIIVGKIELGDKIIISTPTILDIFKLEDIDRLFKTFSAKEFDDIFFKTLKREGDNISAVIVNIEAEEELDYSKSKSLNNEDLPLEELTKNKNFLGGDTKPKKDKSKDSVLSDDLPKIATSQIKKPSSTAKTKSVAKSDTLDSPKKIQKSKDSLSKKQALDKAQKEASADKKQTKITKEKLPTTNIKSISSSTKKPDSKPKLTGGKQVRKLNDLKNIKKKESKLPIVSPFEEMKEIYIKDDNLVAKAKKPSTKKLKSFFHKPNTIKNSVTPSIQVEEAPRVQKVSVSPAPVPKTIVAPSSHSESATKHIPNTEQIILNTPSQKQNTPANLNQKTSSVIASEYLKKIGILIKTGWRTILKLVNSGTGSLKSLYSKQIKSFKVKPQISPHSQINSLSSQPQGKINIKTVKTVFNKLLLFIQLLIKKVSPIFKPLLKKLTPFTKKYRTVILVVLFIILTLLVIGALAKSKRNKETAEKLKLPEAPIVNESKSAIENKNQTRKILSLSTTIKLLAENDNVLITYTEDSQLYEIDKKTNEPEKLTLPENIKLSEIKAIDYIESLNLFFLSSDKATISYSPKVKKFIPNKITLPTNFKLAGQNTYLSYLYLLDSSSKQIYRYPRATGGFAVSKKWLAKPLTHDAEISAMAIDEHARIAYLDGTVEKYSRGKLVSTKKFKLKSLDFIETTEDLKSYYLLSKDEGKILKINKSNDSIEKEYQNAAIQNTTTFTVDEKTKLLHIFSDKELLSIDL